MLFIFNHVIIVHCQNGGIGVCFIRHTAIVDALCDDASDIMAVGRTDGSIFLIQMGSDGMGEFVCVHDFDVDEDE